MIDFRYHLVSLIAVFLAVALGIVIGTTALNQPILADIKNQVTALLHWTVTFLSNDRSERTATEQQIFARMALKKLPGGARGLVSAPGDFEPDRRAELEAIAAEESRLTDSGERGRVPDRIA